VEFSFIFNLIQNAKVELRACLNFLTTENQWFIQDRFLAATLENWKGWKFGGKQSYSTFPFFHFSS
jgi:hypothetical protein